MCITSRLASPCRLPRQLKWTLPQDPMPVQWTRRETQDVRRSERYPSQPRYRARAEPRHRTPPTLRGAQQAHVQFRDAASWARPRAPEDEADPRVFRTDTAPTISCSHSATNCRRLSARASLARATSGVGRYTARSVLFARSTTARTVSASLANASRTFTLSNCIISTSVRRRSTVSISRLAHDCSRPGAAFPRLSVTGKLTRTSRIATTHQREVSGAHSSLCCQEYPSARRSPSLAVGGASNRT